MKLLLLLVGFILLFTGFNQVEAYENSREEIREEKTSEISTAYDDIKIDNTESIQWINLREELVMIHTSSVDRMFERGYLVDLELYLHQKNSLHIRIFDPTFRSHPMTEAESQLLNIPNPNDKVWNDESYAAPLPPLGAGALGGVHEHASILVKIFGDKLDFSRSDFQIKSPWIHFEGQDGNTIHRHATNVTLEFLFDSIGIGLDDQCYVLPDDRRFCTNDNYSLEFYINGEKVQSITDHTITNNDRILISYGTENAEIITNYINELDLQEILS